MRQRKPWQKTAPSATATHDLTAAHGGHHEKPVLDFNQEIRKAKQISGVPAFPNRSASSAQSAVTSCRFGIHGMLRNQPARMSSSEKADRRNWIGQRLILKIPIELIL
jgi:hypothetical protein